MPQQQKAPEGKYWIDFWGEGAWVSESGLGREQKRARRRDFVKELDHLVEYGLHHNSDELKGWDMVEIKVEFNANAEEDADLDDWTQDWPSHEARLEFMNDDGETRYAYVRWDEEA